MMTGFSGCSFFWFTAFQCTSSCGCHLRCRRSTDRIHFQLSEALEVLCICLGYPPPFLGASWEWTLLLQKIAILIHRFLFLFFVMQQHINSFHNHKIYEFPLVHDFCHLLWAKGYRTRSWKSIPLYNKPILSFCIIPYKSEKPIQNDLQSLQTRGNIHQPWKRITL